MIVFDGDEDDPDEEEEAAAGRDAEPTGRASRESQSRLCDCLYSRVSHASQAL